MDVVSLIYPISIRAYVLVCDQNLTRYWGILPLEKKRKKGVKT